jgi:hypothetical protein
MKPVGIVKSFADLARVLREVSTESEPMRPPPKTMDQVRRDAELFVARHRREANRVDRRVPQTSWGPRKSG